MQMTSPDNETARSAACAPRSLHRSLLPVLLGLLLTPACAMTPKLPPPPPKYVYAEEHPAAQPAANSLWREGASLVEDTKARRLNDLVTILITESTAASGKADTNAKRDSSLDASVGNVFNLPLSWSVNGGRYLLNPAVSGGMTDNFKGSGSTTRQGTLVGTITAKVVEVMPNGNLVLESRKELTINNEKQIMVLRGMVRPDDISMNNTIASSKVADAQVYYVGDGVIQDKQRPGWLVRLIDRIWPF